MEALVAYKKRYGDLKVPQPFIVDKNNGHGTIDRRSSKKRKNRNADGDGEGDSIIDDADESSFLEQPPPPLLPASPEEPSRKGSGRRELSRVAVDKGFVFPPSTWGLPLGIRVNAIRSNKVFGKEDNKDVGERRARLDEIGFVWSLVAEGRVGTFPLGRDGNFFDDEVEEDTSKFAVVGDTSGWGNSKKEEGSGGEGPSGGESFDPKLITRERLMAQMQEMRRIKLAQDGSDEEGDEDAALLDDASSSSSSSSFSSSGSSSTTTNTPNVPSSDITENTGRGPSSSASMFPPPASPDVPWKPSFPLAPEGTLYGPRTRFPNSPLSAFLKHTQTFERMREANGWCEDADEIGAEAAEDVFWGKKFELGDDRSKTARYLKIENEFDKMDFDGFTFDQVVEVIRIYKLEFLDKMETDGETAVDIASLYGVEDEVIKEPRISDDGKWLDYDSGSGGDDNDEDDDEEEDDFEDDGESNKNLLSTNQNNSPIGAADEDRLSMRTVSDRKRGDSPKQQAGPPKDIRFVVPLNYVCGVPNAPDPRENEDEVDCFTSELPGFRRFSREVNVVTTDEMSSNGMYDACIGLAGVGGKRVKAVAGSTVTKAQRMELEALDAASSGVASRAGRGETDDGWNQNVYGEISDEDDESGENEEVTGGYSFIENRARGRKKKAYSSFANVHDSTEAGRKWREINESMTRLKADVPVVDKNFPLTIQKADDEAPQTVNPVDLIEWPKHLHGLKLGRIVARLRTGDIGAKGVPWKCAALEKAGMDWGGPERVSKWIKVPLFRCTRALHRYNYLRGDMCVPLNFVVPREKPWLHDVRGMKLGRWVNTLRSQEAMIMRHYMPIYRRLNMMGFLFLPSVELKPKKARSDAVVIEEYDDDDDEDGDDDDGDDDDGDEADDLDEQKGE